MPQTFTYKSFKVHVVLSESERKSFIPAKVDVVFEQNTGKIFMGNGETPGGVFLTSKKYLTESSVDDSAMWGLINGDIADQADLQAALAAIVAAIPSPGFPKITGIIHVSPDSPDATDTRVPGDQFNPEKPYVSRLAAQTGGTGGTAAVSGNIIMCHPGDYPSEAIDNVDGVNWIYDDGAKVTLATTGPGHRAGEGVVSKICGLGEFVGGQTDNNLGYFMASDGGKLTVCCKRFEATNRPMMSLEGTDVGTRLEVYTTERSLHNNSSALLDGRAAGTIYYRGDCAMEGAGPLFDNDAQGGLCTLIMVGQFVSDTNPFTAASNSFETGTTIIEGSYKSQTRMDGRGHLILKNGDFEFENNVSPTDAGGIQYNGGEKGFSSLTLDNANVKNIGGVGIVLQGDNAPHFFYTKGRSSIASEGNRAVGTLTFSGNPADGKAVTVGAQSYEFKTALAFGFGNEVLIGATAEDTMDNLIAAIDQADGSGTTYSYGFGGGINLDIFAKKVNSTDMLAAARTGGTAGNSLATTETSAVLAWTGATLAGGTGGFAALGFGDDYADDVEDDINFLNLDLFPETDASFTIASSDDRDASAKINGCVGPTGIPLYQPGVKATETLTVSSQPNNSDAVTVDGKVYTFQTVLTDVDGNVLIGATTEDSQDNLVAAVNLGTGKGTKYAASMTLHPTVSAADGAGTTLIATAKTAGDAGNSIVVLESTGGVRMSWGAGTLSGGTPKITNTLDSGFQGSDNYPKDWEGFSIPLMASSGTLVTGGLFYDFINSRLAFGNGLANKSLAARTTIPLDGINPGVTQAVHGTQGITQVLYAHNVGSDIGGILLGAKSSGTPTAPELILGSSSLLSLRGAAFDGSEYKTVAKLDARMVGTVSASSLGCGWQWGVTPQGTVTLQTAMALTDTGILSLAALGNMVANIGLGVTGFSSGTQILGLKNGTPPSAGVADSCLLYAADFVAGNSVLHVKTEGGRDIRILSVAGWGTPTGTLTRSTFDTTTVTTEQLAERVAALISDLKTQHRFIRT